MAHPTYGAGGVFCLDLGSLETAERFMEHMQNHWHFGFMAVSLGYFDTLMSASAVSTSSEMPDEDQRRAGISDGLVRISIGYTGSLEQRWQQFEQGLHQVGAISTSPA
jgi:methionine-gamma-lyase